MPLTCRFLVIPWGIFRRRRCAVRVCAAVVRVHRDCTAEGNVIPVCTAQWRCRGAHLADSPTLAKLLNFIIAEVIRHHEVIASESLTSMGAGTQPPFTPQ